MRSSEKQANNTLNRTTCSWKKKKRYYYISSAKSDCLPVKKSAFVQKARNLEIDRRTYKAKPLVELLHQLKSIWNLLKCSQKEMSPLQLLMRGTYFESRKLVVLFADIHQEQLRNISGAKYITYLRNSVSWRCDLLTNWWSTTLIRQSVRCRIALEFMKGFYSYRINWNKVWP